MEPRLNPVVVVGRKYKNPPIIEAVCEFRFAPSSPWDLAIPGIVYQEVQKEFPTRRQGKGLAIALATEKESGKQEISAMGLMQFYQKDEKALIQVGMNLLAVNHLKPYPAWEGFLPLIRRGFDAYRKVAEPTGIQRIGLRYINRIELPGPRIELKDYFSFHPFLGPSLPQDYDALIVGVEIPYEQGKEGLRLQLTNSPLPNQPETVAFHLDIDYFLRPTGKVEMADVFQWVDKAHARLDELFEGCITDKLRERFEEVKN